MAKWDMIFGRHEESFECRVHLDMRPGEPKPLKITMKLHENGSKSLQNCSTRKEQGHKNACLVPAFGRRPTHPAPTQTQV